MYIVARIDGRGFTRLTKEVHQFEAPFDEKFRDLMVETVKHLMNCGFNIIYGYTESDEISLLFHPNENLFGRKTRKYISILAGEASAKFSSLLGSTGAFDCRLSELPNKKLIADYFRWRNEDAHRNALNAHCYWRLRQDNYTINEATSKIEGMSTAAKNELLFQYGINFNNIPTWQKRGIGLYWKNAKKEGFNPRNNEHVLVDK
jgi:tRNA(His) guanylyltransferase